MPPTLVRPQTFDPNKSPDSASPAVRYGHLTCLGSPQAACPLVSEQNSYLICVLQGCRSHCPVSLSQSANCLVRVRYAVRRHIGRIRFSAPSRKSRTSTVRLSVPVVWVGHRPLQLLYNLRNHRYLKILCQKCKQESSKPCPAFLSACRLGKPQTFIRHVSSLKAHRERLRKHQT